MSRLKLKAASFRVEFMLFRLAFKENFKKVKRKVWSPNLIFWSITALILRAVIGMLQWPPPSMKSYAALSGIIGLGGIGGVVIGGIIGFLGLFFFTRPRGNLKLASFSLVFGFLGGMTLNFFLVGQGMGVGTFLTLTIMCLPALFSALPHKEIESEGEAL